MILPLTAPALCVLLILPLTSKKEDQALAGYVKVEIQGVLQVEDGFVNWSTVVGEKRVLVTITAPGPRDMRISKHWDGPGGGAPERRELVKKPAGITWELVLGANKDFHDFMNQHKGQLIVVKGTMEIVEEFGGPDGKAWTTAAPGHTGPPPSPRVMVKVAEMQAAKPKKK